MKVRDPGAAALRPDPRWAGVLLSGEPARVGAARDALLLALLGPEGEAEMRLERVPGAEARRDGARVGDALRAVGFFPGERVVLVEEATDGLAPLLSSALDARGPGDARLVAVGGALPARGALRRLFEERRDAAALTFYDDPLSAAEAARLAEALGPLPPDAHAGLLARAGDLDPPAFRALVERLDLFRVGGGEVTLEAVEALAPAGEAEVDALLLAVTEGRADLVPGLLAGLAARGVGPVAVALAAGRHLRALLAVASDPGGPEAGLGRLRPPAGGARREALLRGARAWRRERVEAGVRAVLELDARLRSASRAPPGALVEAALLALARG